MGILELATLVLAILKLMGLITISWLWVFAPLIVALVLYFGIMCVFGVFFFKNLGQ